MENDHVCEVLVPAQIDKIFQHVATSVDTFSIGHNDGHLFEELQESGGGIS
jgi:hypothetical protein